MNMLLHLLSFWARSEQDYQRDHKLVLADTVLRNAVAVIIGFFGMRRAAECFLSKTGRMGLRMGDVQVQVLQHVTLFIQSQKNDTYARGSEVVLSWSTESGISIGGTIEQYLEQLIESGIQP